MGDSSSYRDTLFQITGDKEIDARLGKLEREAQSRIARPAVAAAVRVIAKELKSKTQVSAVKKAIGSRVVKVTPDDVDAKAGVGVGRSRHKKKTQRVKQSRGIANPVWYVLGTEERYTGARSWKTKVGERRTKLTGKPKAYRGKMPAHKFVRQASASALKAAAEKAREVALKKLGEIG